MTSLLNERNIQKFELTDKMATNTFYKKYIDKLFLELWLKFWTLFFVSDYKTHLSETVCASVFKWNGERTEPTLMDLIRSCFLNPLCLKWRRSLKSSVGIFEFQWRLLPSKISMSRSEVKYGLKHASNLIIHCKFSENLWWFLNYWQWRWHIQTWWETADQYIKTFWSVLS